MTIAKFLFNTINILKDSDVVTHITVIISVPKYDENHLEFFKSVTLTKTQTLLF